MQAPLSFKVFGSTSNLGPGFDLLGLCLDLALKVQVDWQAKAGEHGFAQFSGSARHLPQDPSNLVSVAYDATLEHFQVQPSKGPVWSLDSAIPVARGLGSSGASVAAGLLAACHAANLDPKQHLTKLLEIGTQIEGHPDNVVASLVGGCTLALQTDAGLHVVQAPLHPSLGVAIAWGASPMPTPLARKLLPDTIPFDQAADQPRRTVALLEGLRLGDPDLLRHGQTDHLHVPARLPHIRGAAQGLQAAQTAGAWLATISGSGSSLVALCPKEKAQAIAYAMAQAIQSEDPPAVGQSVAIIGPLQPD